MAIAVNKKIGVRQVQFTPYWFDQAFKRWQQGNPADVIALMERVEADAYVYGCLEGRRSGVAKPVIVKAASNNTIDMDRAAWLQQILQPMTQAGLLEDYQSARLYGFAVVDYEWAVVDKRIVPVAHELIDRKYFKRDPKTDELKVDWGNELRDIDPGAQVVEYNRMPALLPTAEAYIRMRFGEDAWSAFLESFGMPYILVYYSPGTGDEAKAEAEETAENLAQNARATAPDNRDLNGKGPVEIIESGRTTGDHEAYIKNLCQRKISLNLLGHANAAEDGTGMRVGENQAPVKAAEGVAHKDCLFAQQRLQALAERIWGYNFGGGAPQIIIDTKAPITHTELRQSVDMALRYGVPVSAADLQKVGLQTQDTMDWFERPKSPLDY